MDMQIYVIRHGETAMNLKSRLQGWLDEPLNENGMLVASLTGKALREARFDRVISSPLSRARDTARLIMEENLFPNLIETDDRLREIRWGCWEESSRITSSSMASCPGWAYFGTCMVEVA